MFLNIKKFFFKPDKVTKKNYGIYFIVQFICILSIITTLTLLALAFIVNIWPLALLNILGLCATLYIIYINRQGNHILAIGLYAACMYLYSVNAVIMYGWQAGFQYYLIPLSTLLFLNQKFNNKYVAIFAFFPFCTFLLLNTLTLEPQNNQENLYTFLHAYNTFNVFLALAFVNYFFRTSVNRFFSRLDKSSNTDVLTGLMNRRRMNLELSRYCNITKRYEDTSSILLIDIDNFKQINDEHGHIAGDSILKQFTNLITSHLRKTDLLARWGGDEFLVLTPSTNIESAEQLANELYQAVQHHDFNYETRIVNLNITIGVNELLPQRTMEDSLKKADQLLSQGKSNDRKRVVTEQY